MRGFNVLVSLCALMLFATSVTAGGKKSAKKDIAKQIVTQVADIKEKEIVVVGGDLRDIDLIEEIVIEVLKAGAQPIQFVSREKFSKRYYEEVPQKYDAARLDLETKLANLTQVEINIQATQDPGLLKRVDPKRLAAISDAYKSIPELKQKRNVRRIALGNGLYPTKATAKQLGVTKQKLEKIFWSGLNVDYAKLQARGEKLKAILAAGKEVHIKNPNGTDLKLKIEGRPVSMSDGVISAEDVKKGGPATQVWLPAGEVFLAPVPGTAEGKLVIDRLPWSDGVVQNLNLTFKAGKLDQMTAKQNAAFKRLKEQYQAASAGKEIFAILDIGINPNVKATRKGKFRSWVAEGTVSAGFGNNLWAGGENNVQWTVYGNIPGCTVNVDGKAVVAKGKLKLSE